MKDKKEVVKELLQKHPEGLTIAEIAKILNFSRNTVAIKLEGLIGAELVRVRPVGKAKLHYWHEGAKR